MMPPKGKAKAAPKAKAKGKAKAKAKAKGGARPFGGRVGLRRPARGGVAPPVGPLDLDPEGFEKGEQVSAHLVPPLSWKPGIFVALEGTYWQGPAEVAGRLVSYVQEGDNREIVVEVRGTTAERLLKWASGQAVAQPRVHLCPTGCSDEKVNDDYFHAKKVLRIPPGLMAPWMSCLEPGGVDELEELRRGMDGKGKERKEDRREEQRKSGESSSGKSKKKKKKRKKKKRKEAKEKKKEKKSSCSSEAKARLSGLSSQRSEETRQGVRRDRSGSTTGGAETDQEESKEEFGQKRKEGLIEQQQLLRKQRRELKQRRAVPRRPQGQGSSSEGSWSSGSSSCRRDERISGDFVRPGLEFEWGRSHTPIGTPVLQDGDEVKDEWWNGKRSADDSVHCGFRTSRSYRRSYGRRPSTAEVPGVKLQWDGLSGQPTNRVGSLGSRGRSIHHRTSSSSTGSSRRGEAETPKWKGRRLDKRRLLEGRLQREMGETRRKRQGEKGRSERRRLRQRRPGRGRKEGGQRKEMTFPNSCDRELDGYSWTPSSGLDLDDEVMFRRDGDGLDDAVQYSISPRLPGYYRRGNASVQQPGREEDPSCEVGMRRTGVTGGTGVSPGQEVGTGLIAGQTSLGMTGLTYGESATIIAELWANLSQCSLRHCKAQSPGKGIFPLPTVHSDALKGLLGEFESGPLVFFNLCRALNSLAGMSMDEVAYDGSSVQHGALRYLKTQSDRLCGWSEKFEELSWEKLFKVKGVDYRGEEVLVAKYVGWKHLEPALPNEVGSVNLLDVVELGMHHYVKNFEEYLMPFEDMVPSRSPQVMIPPDEWEAVAQGLISKGICGIIGEDEVFRVKGVPVLNGMFGVSKNEWVEDVEVHRLIMAYPY